MTIKYVQIVNMHENAPLSEYSDKYRAKIGLRETVQNLGFHVTRRNGALARKGIDTFAEDKTFPGK